MGSKKLSLLKQTLLLRAFALLRIPMIAWVRPTVLQLDADRAVVRVPLFRHTRNHLRSMYFGALATGADCAVGLHAMHVMREILPKPLHFSFKSFQAEFHRRAEDDVIFVCHEGRLIREKVEEAARTKERVSFPVKATAHVGSASSEPVASFVLELSLKKK
ncbi:MAG: DUF4442 domain-containing protein [Bdellovibrionales bacterium]|nr:DUF4442 domain-containing protein [Bdellovibrionales bacterium]